jgi:LCP family protein required for cell wall assembly
MDQAVDMDRKKPKIKQRPITMDRTNIVLLSVFAFLALTTAIIAFFFVRNLINTWSLTQLPGAPELTAPLATLEPGMTALPTELQGVDLQPQGGPTSEPWDGASRVNILIMGLDYRDWLGGDIPRTDTMILFTLDPVSMTAGMLSIPRDMWVNVPGFDYNKINTAFFLGEAYKLPGGGPALAVATVEQFLGVPIQYYAQVDFNSFARFIDEIGGIDVYVREKMHVAIVGKPGFDLQEGVQAMDGPTALAYVRNRSTEGDDFARSQRQQDVIIAIRDQILNFNQLPNLISKAPVLYKELSTGVRTNLTLDQVIKLALLAQQIDVKNIRRGAIGSDSAYPATSPDGLSILIPIPDKVRLDRDEIFTVGGPVGPVEVNGDPAELMKAEKTRISVQNGTQMVDLATRTGEYFRSLGLNVVEETNADQFYDGSVMIVYTGKPYTIKFLSDTMKIPTSRIFNRYNPDSQVDVAVILGNDWAVDNTIP